MSAAQQAASGRLHTVWDGAESPLHVLIRPDGSPLRLLPGSDAVERALLSGDRRLADVSGSTTPEGSLRVERIGTAAAMGARSSQSYDFATLLCRFPDTATPSVSKEEIERVHGTEYPGMRHYFTELSLDPGIMSGSTVRGWYTMPRPASEYADPPSLQFLGSVAADCAAAADEDVDFSRVHGINLVLSGGSPFGPRGGSWTLTLDGQTRSWGMTWSPVVASRSYATVAHEMGHALGWPHSSGMYGATYDSRWDMMSGGRASTAFGPVAIHTIAFYKDRAGWIPEERRWLPPADGSETVFLARSALPPPDGALLAEIPISDSSAYVVESRIRAGYDVNLPAEAVVIHKTRAFNNRAFVVDPDLNGDPNDDGAAWLPGEAFEDPDIGLTVAVLERRGDDGFLVRVTRNSANVCTLTMSADGGGKVLVTAGAGSLECGKRARVTAYAATGWRFEGWRRDGALVSTDVDYWVDLTTDVHMVAGFVEEPGCTVALSAHPDTVATVEVVAGGATGPCGRTVSLLATPVRGWSLVGWREGPFLVGWWNRAQSFQVDSSRTFRAEFEPGCRVDAIPQPRDGGTVRFGEGGEIGPCGRTVTIDASAEAGWRLDGWVVGGRVVSTDPTFTFAPDTQSIVFARFAESCDVVLAAEPSYGGTPSVTEGGVQGPCGRDVTLTASPAPAWLFAAWTEDGAVVTRDATFTTTADTPRSLRATYLYALDLATRVRGLLLGTEATLTQDERDLVDRHGNGNGSLDLGDLLALIDRLPDRQAARFGPPEGGSP